MHQLTVLYGSQTGTATLAARHFATRLAFTFPQARVVCQALNEFPFEQLVEESFVFILVATTGFGAFPVNASAFWQRLTLPLPSSCLEDLNVAVFGFGDSSYQQFNHASRFLAQRLRQLEAQFIQPLALADESKGETIGQKLTEWENSNIRWLSSHIQPAIQSVDPLPRYTVVPANVAVSSPPPPATSNQDRPVIQGEVASLEELTSKDSDNQVFQLAIKSEGLSSFSCGDCLCLFHKNSVDQVQKMAEFIEEGLGMAVTIGCHELVHRFHQKWPVGIPVSVESLLTDYVDFQKPVSFSQFKSLAEVCLEPIYSQKISEMTFDDFYEYAVRERRALWEILFDFQIPKVDLTWVLNVCSPLRPREFSIASAPSRLPSIHIIFGTVDYKTPFGSQLIRKDPWPGHLFYEEFEARGSSLLCHPALSCSLPCHQHPKDHRLHRNGRGCPFGLSGGPRHFRSPPRTRLPCIAWMSPPGARFLLWKIAAEPHGEGEGPRGLFAPRKGQTIRSAPD
jgi:sulfite reductase alpha subunit-like flavoprotein